MSCPGLISLPALDKKRYPVVRCREGMDVHQEKSIRLAWSGVSGRFHPRYVPRPFPRQTLESITKSLSMPWEETLLTLVWDYQADLCVSGPPYFPSASLLLFTSSAMFRVFPTYPSQRSCEVCVCSCNTHHSASCKIEHRRASRSSSEPSKRW